MELAAELLVKELNVCTQEEANHRIFFVSAKEALQACLQEQNPPADSKNNQVYKYQLLVVIVAVMGNRRDVWRAWVTFL